jgi:para-nitrobenzyl esterase
MYYFRWPSVVREHKLKAYHCIDIPFAFDNVEVATSMTGTTQDRYTLATRFSSAFASFARTGDPNTDGVPRWPRFDAERRTTMFVANEWGAVDDPHAAERRVLAKLR